MAMSTAREQDDLPKLAAPARRALAGVGITRLSQLTRVSESRVAHLHGMGPSAIKRLREALKARGLAFARRELALRPSGLPDVAPDAGRDGVASSWRRLRELGVSRVYPGHGPPRPIPDAAAQES
jgi:hypothetical protein